MADTLKTTLLKEQSSQTVSFNLNGQPVRVDVPPDAMLLDVLREDLGIISPKNGCAPQAQCGCCTVLVDGNPRLSCAQKATKIEGRSITTLEGIDPELREQVAECFVRAGGVQCGFCIPGFAMRSLALLSSNPSPNRSEIAGAFKGNLCRCTGYDIHVRFLIPLSNSRFCRLHARVPLDACGGSRPER
jgi:aerobic-type carbon monoxide dehydrogenase small subunit (CoxS/CutS family)